MKANELRIGNIIYTTKRLLDDNSFSTKDSDYRPIYISGIDGENLRDSHGYTYYIENYKPIPLTSEWLAALGFEDERLDLGDDWYTLYSYNDEGFVFMRNNERLRVIKHVHQLQNLYFALTGEELTIKEPV